MKTSEQMTKDVLARRNKELKDNAAKRRRMLMIGAPCATALFIAAAIGIDSALPIEKRYIHKTIAREENSAAGYFSSGAPGAANDSIVNNSSAAPNEMTSGPEICSSGADSSFNASGSGWVEPVGFDFTNPKSGQNDIHVIEVGAFNSENNTVVKDPMDLASFTMEGLYLYYGIEFDRLTKLHSSWGLQHEPFGIYKRQTSDGFSLSLTMYWTRNTLNYTTEKGAKVTVSAQIGKFDPLSFEQFAKDKHYTPTYPYLDPPTYPDLSTPPYTSDPAASYGGAASFGGTGAYNPENDPNRPTNDEGVSLLNGYDAYIYRDYKGNFAADIDMGTRVRITAIGLSDDEFLQILDEYTA